MQKNLIALALAAVCTVPAFAEEAPTHSFSANVGVVSDYLFRGISQTQHHPALQAGVDYSHGSGLYVGAWGSNVSWVRATDISDKNAIELDLYGGYKGAVGDFTYDVGAIRYYYPKGNINPGLVTPDTTEAYLGLGWKYVSFKYSHVLSDYFIGWVGTNGEKTKGSQYYDLTVTYPIDETLNVIAHVGRQNVNDFSAASYTDYKLGVTKDFGFGVVGLTYSDTNAKGGVGEAYRWDGKDVSKGVLVASFLKTF